MHCLSWILLCLYCFSWDLTPHMFLSNRRGEDGMKYASCSVRDLTYGGLGIVVISHAACRGSRRSPGSGRHSGARVSESRHWYIAFHRKATVDRKVTSSARRGIQAVQSTSMGIDGTPQTPYPSCSASASWGWWIGLCGGLVSGHFAVNQPTWGRWDGIMAGLPAGHSPPHEKLELVVWPWGGCANRGCHVSEPLSDGLPHSAVVLLVPWKPGKVGNFNPEEVAGPSGIQIWKPCTPIVFSLSIEFLGYYMSVSPSCPGVKQKKRVT